MDAATPARAHWETFPHGADIGVRGCGPTREAAFAMAATALTALVTDPRRVRSRRAVELTAEGGDDETLLVAFLDAVIFELSAHDLLLSRYAVSIAGPKLTARALGETVDVARHRPAVEPKGATYTELRVAQTGDGGWVAQCVIDV